jgi:hypothetical protein
VRIPTDGPGGPSYGRALVVHLRRADYEDPAVRATWHARGYATVAPMEGHDPDRRCPICSDGGEPEPEPERGGCPMCGTGPCPLAALLAGRTR